MGLGMRLAFRIVYVLVSRVSMIIIVHGGEGGAEVLDFSSEVEVSSNTTRKAKCPCKKKKTADSASTDGNTSTSKAAQAQGLKKPRVKQGKGRL